MTKGNTIVCDIGSYAIKIGFAGSLSPAKVVPTVVGVPTAGDSNEKVLFGQEVKHASHRQKLSLSYPMNEKSEIIHWDFMESLLLHTFEEIGISREEFSKYKLLLTKPSWTKKADFIKLFDLFFKKLKFRAATIHEQAALVLYTRGIETGVVVELGESSVRIVPVYKGHAIPQVDQKMSLGGRTMSIFLMKLLRLRGYHMEAKENGLEDGHQIKEDACYVALDPEVEEGLARETTATVESVVLRNGTTVIIGQERFAAAEILFNPSLCDSETKGLSHMIFDTIQKADIDCRMDLYQNVVLSGGMSLLPGIDERIQEDLVKLYEERILAGERHRSPGWKPRVHIPNSREFLVYEGAALFADFIQNDRAFWVTQRDYNRQGADALFATCTI